MDTQEEKRQGISLFKIDYEIDGQKEGTMWSAGIVAYSSEEAVKSLAKFLRESHSDFKGFKINQLSFQGQVHHLSDPVREQIVKGSQVITKAELKDEKPKKKTTAKKSILK